MSKLHKPYTLLFLYPNDGHGPETYQCLSSGKDPKEAYDLAVLDMAAEFGQDVSKLQNDEGVIPVEKLGEFLALVESRPLRLPTYEQLEAAHCKVSLEGENSVEAWHKFLSDHRQELVDFIKKAIEMNEPIDASL